VPFSLGKVHRLRSDSCRGSICFAHIRFRKAWIAQGNTVDDLPFKAAAGTYGSWLGLLLNILCLIAQFYVALFPIGEEPNASTFFRAYLAVPVILVFFVFWKIVKKTHFVRPKEADVLSGRRLLNLHELRTEDIEKQSHWSPIKKYTPISDFLS
jgi:yeast amino acid transporter